MSSKERAPPLTAEDDGKGELERVADRGGREQRPDDPKAKRDRAALYELARDPGLLRGRRWIDLADDLPDLALGPVRPVDESERADQEREQRDEPEEDLVRDGARQEGTLVGEEALQNGAEARDEPS